MPTSTFFNLPEDKREAIVALAIAEFAKNDYQNASISRIVARAGIAKGSFYQYFADKRDLYLYLLDLAAQEKRDFLAANRPPDPQMGLFAYLRWLFEVGVQFEFSKPGLSQVGYRAVYSEHALPEETLKQIKSQLVSFYQGLIEQGITQGDIDPAIDRDLAAFVLGTLFNELGTFIYRKLDIQPDDFTMGEFTGEQEAAFRSVFDGLLHILEQGMGVPSEEPEAVP